MGERYEIVNRGGKTDRWALHRIDDDPEFGFNKLVGLFDRKPELQHALDRIVLHKDHNFAEWFYTQRVFYKGDRIVHQERLARELYAVWRTIGGHMAVDAKRMLLTDIASSYAETFRFYEDRIDDIQEAHAIELAGEAW